MLPLLAILVVLLGAHHALKTIRGLRTGVIEGLMLGYGSKRYSRTEQPDAFWANARAGFVMAAIGAVAFLWFALTIWFIIDGTGL